jgi:hypothetical protein
MSDAQIITLVIGVIAAGFAVTILRNNRMRSMRSLSVAVIFVVGYVLSAVAQNSTPELDNPAIQVAPNIKSLPPELDGPAARVAPIIKSLPPEPDSPAMQTLQSLAPALDEPTTQAIPRPGLVDPKPDIECRPYRTEDQCEPTGCRNVIVKSNCPN